MLKWMGAFVLFCVSALLPGSVAVAAEIVSTLADQQEVAVTIYNEDLALVRDQRQVTLPQGTVTLALREVSARIRPETALLRSLTRPDGLAILEQNFDFDLLTRVNYSKNMSAKRFSWCVHIRKPVRIVLKQREFWRLTMAWFCRSVTG